MNSLKPLLVVAVLAGIGYGVYTRINRGPSGPPPGAPVGFDAAPPVVQFGPDNGTSQPAPWGDPGHSSAPPAVPPFGAPSDGSPLAITPPPGAPSASGAPPFTPPPVANGNTSAPPFNPAPGASAPPAAGDPALNSAPAYAPPGNPNYSPAPAFGSPDTTAQNSGVAAPYDPSSATPGGNPAATAPPGNDAVTQTPPYDPAQAYSAPPPYGTSPPPATSDPSAPPAGDPWQDAPPVGPPVGASQDVAGSTQPPSDYSAAGSPPPAYGQDAPPAAYGQDAPPAESAYAAAGAAPPANAGEQPPPSNDVRGGATFADAMESARQELNAGRLPNALRQLSTWYEDSRLSANEQQQLTEVLDQIAGTVVYSTQHLLEPPYEVQPGERLEDVANKYNVPWQLLAKINGLDDPHSLQPGERLKVVRGPFNALISLDKRQITLMLNGSYAGRFPIGIGGEHPPREGTFAVTEKVVNPTYHGLNRSIDADDPANPLGERWVGLEHQLSIHGTNDPESVGRTDLPGCISLGSRDVDDVFDILSVGSKVVIRR